MLLRLTAIIVLMSLVLVGCTGSGDDRDSKTEERILAGRGFLDPEAYRAEIENLESVLYKDAPADFADFGRVTAATMRLYGKAMQQEKHPLKIEAAQRIMFLRSRADMSDVGFSTPDMAAVRSDWEGVRLHVFGEADWFHKTTAGLSRVQTPAAPAADPLDVSELSRVIERLEDLIGDGRRECDDLGEPVYEPTRMSQDGEAQVDDWRTFHKDWSDRIDYIADRMPSQPSWNGSQDFTMAHQSVGQAMNELRLVPVGVGDWVTPFRGAWEGRFDQAQRKLEEARGHLANLQRN